MNATAFEGAFTTKPALYCRKEWSLFQAGANRIEVTSTVRVHIDA
jgi:hypothetical protein